MKFGMKRVAGLLCAGVLALAAPLAHAENDVAVVVKIGGVPWFNAMDAGIKKAGKDLSVDAWMVGPTVADAAQQVRAVEDLIARKVKVIAVVPNDAKALEPVFKRAHDAGIKILTHESPDQKGNDWNIELTSVAGLGEAHMDSLAKAMGGKGKYALFVGSLTVPLHNAWADAAIAYQKKKYPEMTMVADRFGVAESVDESSRTTQDLLRANPDLKGIIAFGSQGPIGAGRVVSEKKLIGKVAVVGLFSAGQGAKLVKEGAIVEGFIWNPGLAGEALVRLGKMVAAGQEPTDGMDFPGIGKASVNKATRNILVQKLEAINKTTIDKFVALGL